MKNDHFLSPHVLSFCTSKGTPFKLPLVFLFPLFLVQCHWLFFFSLFLAYFRGKNRLQKPCAKVQCSVTHISFRNAFRTVLIHFRIKERFLTSSFFLSQGLFIFLIYGVYNTEVSLQCISRLTKWVREMTWCFWRDPRPAKGGRIESKPFFLHMSVPLPFMLGLTYMHPGPPLNTDTRSKEPVIPQAHWPIFHCLFKFLNSWSSI